MDPTKIFSMAVAIECPKAKKSGLDSLLRMAGMRSARDVLTDGRYCHPTFISIDETIEGGPVEVAKLALALTTVTGLPVAYDNLEAVGRILSNNSHAFLTGVASEGSSLDEGTRDRLVPLLSSMQDDCANVQLGRRIFSVR